MHEIFEKRKATRAYADKPVPSDKIEAIVAAAESSPSAGGLDARSIVVVENAGKIRKIANSAGQSFIAKAPVVFVFFALPELSGTKYGARGESLYAIQDATIAASFAWIEAVNQGLAGCWVGAFVEEQIVEIVKADEKSRPVALLPIGFPK
ncbi:nitroreductase family protein [Patescibacteria group bacterium]